MDNTTGTKRQDKSSCDQNTAPRKSRKTCPKNVDGEIPVNPSEVETGDQQDISRVIDLGEGTFPESHGIGTYMGPSHGEDPYSIQFMDKRNDAGLIPFVTSAIRPINNEVAFTVYQRECECDKAILSVWKNKTQQLEKIVAPYKEQSIALFFRFVDWTYPAVDKKRFYRSYFHHDPPMHRGLMFSMSGLGCTYWKYSTHLCTKVIPPHLAQDLWQMALYNIEHDVNCLGATLDTVAALLSYLQKRQAGDGMHELVTARLHMGTLTSLSFALGLHLDCSDWDISPIEKLARKRLWALVFYSEKWSAANSGHPSMLTVGNDECDFNSQYPQERWFVQLIKVTNILSKVSSNLYNTSKPLPPEAKAEVAESLLADLRGWWLSSPEDLANIKAKNDLRYCSNGMLHLSALTVEVSLFRILISPVYGGKYRHEARDLVQHIISFCIEITHPHLHAFWLSPCRSNLSALAHFVLRYHAQSPESERKHNTPLMRSWIECLRSLSHGWEEGVGLAYHRMDALFYRGQTASELPIADETYRLLFKSEDAYKSREDSQIEEPLGLEEDTTTTTSGDSPANVLFAGDNLHDLLYDLIWE